ncbi:MAG: flagellar basal body P-ring formation chaperone FlgA [bacterium]|jgi:flagella basal body P-ring formation protein FlgA
MRAKTKGLATGFALAVALSSVAPAFTGAAAATGLADRIAEETAEFVTRRVTLPYDSISVDVSVPAIAARAADVAHFSVDLYGTPRAVVGTVPVKVTVTLHDGQSIPYAATARVRIWSDAAVSARRLKRHETLDEDDVRMERREVTNAIDGYFARAEEVTGMRTTRVISPGGLLMVSSIEPVPLICRGSAVSVTVVIGAVAITSRGKALEDGDLGSLIEVRDCATGKRMTGEVAGENAVVLNVSRL